MVYHSSGISLLTDTYSSSVSAQVRKCTQCCTLSARCAVFFEKSDNQ